MRKLFSSLLCLLLSCLALYSQGLKIEGLAAQGYFYSPVQSAASSAEYMVWFQITNNSQRVVVFDTVKIFWQCRPGGMLPSLTKKDPGGVFQLKPGDQSDFSYGTNGHTSDLLANKGGQPIDLVVLLFMGNNLIAGPFIAEVPDLDKMPLRSFINGSKKDWAELPKLIFELGVLK